MHQSKQQRQIERSCIGGVIKMQESQETKESCEILTRVTAKVMCQAAQSNVSSLTRQIDTTGHRNLVGSMLDRILVVHANFAEAALKIANRGN